MATRVKTKLTPLQIYSRLLKYIKPDWTAFAVAGLCMVIYAACSPALAALVQPLLDGTFVERDPEAIKFVPLMLIFLFALRGTSGFLQSFLMSWIGRRLIKNLRRELFDHILKLPNKKFIHTATGELLAKFSFDVEATAQSVTTAVNVVITDTLTIIGLVGFIIYLSPELATIWLVAGPIIGLLMAWLSRRFRRLSKNIQTSVGDVSRVTEEMIAGRNVVRMFDGAEYEAKRFEVVNEANRKETTKRGLTRAASSPVVQMVAAIAFAFIVYFVTSDPDLGGISPGTFMAVVTAMLQLMPPIKRLTAINPVIQAGIAGGDSIFALLDEKREKDTGTQTLTSVKGHVEFSNVTFAYEEDKGDVVKNVSLDVQPGSTVALVGASGGGKSTIVKLLPRLYEISSGKISIDGNDIRDVTLSSLRANIAMVSQDVILFDDTVANNIAYGMAGKASKDGIVSAAKSAQCYDFIMELPQQFETKLGTNGTTLSGGQRQRIAIARAIMKNAPILILDEATSALDTQSERLIQSALETLMKEKTSLVIAHRLSTIEKADCIHVIHEGEIVESGTHAALTEADGMYAKLRQMQTSH